MAAAAGLQRPDISILSDEFLAEGTGYTQRNLAVELLQKLLKAELVETVRRNATSDWTERKNARAHLPGT